MGIMYRIGIMYRTSIINEVNKTRHLGLTKKTSLLHSLKPPLIYECTKIWRDIKQMASKKNYSYGKHHIISYYN